MGSLKARELSATPEKNYTRRHWAVQGFVILGLNQGQIVIKKKEMYDYENKLWEILFYFLLYSSDNFFIGQNIFSAFLLCFNQVVKRQKSNRKLK